MSAACSGRPDATISAWSVQVIAPPASRTRSSPAAESHGERDTSKYASTRPATTHARSSAADPGPADVTHLARDPREDRGLRGSLGRVVAEPGRYQREAEVRDAAFALIVRSPSAAPLPRAALNSSSRIGSSTAPASAPSRSAQATLFSPTSAGSRTDS